jgi:hypothetical protein
MLNALLAFDDRCLNILGDLFLGCATITRRTAIRVGEAEISYVHSPGSVWTDSNRRRRTTQWDRRCHCRPLTKTLTRVSMMGFGSLL